MQRLLGRLLPFIFIGIALVALAFGIMIFAYLFFIGAVVGMILFVFSWLRNKFFPSKTAIKPQPKTGRIIDSDDWKKL